jgi:hypothetical protein
LFPSGLQIGQSTRDGVRIILTTLGFLCCPVGCILLGGSNIKNIVSNIELEVSTWVNRLRAPGAAL